MGEVQALKTALSRLHANVAPASVAEKLKLTVLVMAKVAGPAVIVVSGGVLSTVTLTPADVARLFEVSTARAVIAAVPSAWVVVSQLRL